jgi:hypothetical protein
VRRLVLIPLAATLLAACTGAATSPSPTASSAVQTARPTVSVATSASPPLTLAPTSAPTPAPPTPTPKPTPVAGWPTVSRSGITMTGRYPDTPPAWEGWPAPGPEVTLEITLAGLAPGEPVSLVGTGAYDLATLGCGVQPSPCAPGSDTTDPSVHLCRPEYAEAANGTATAFAEATAGADGKAGATLRFVVSQSERACPAGPSRPWYVESGEWKLSVTDTTHGLRLVGPPEGIGP